MMIFDLPALRGWFREKISDALGQDPGEFVFEYPPTVALGDLALNIAFGLAKTLRRAPRQIAAEIIEKVPAPPGVARMEVAGAGYVNLYFDRAAVLRALYAERDNSAATRPERPRVTVEHTSVNPNKAAHIGHLRNACLGDTLARLLKFLGEPVVVQNYIDDTGVQVADVVVGFRHILGYGKAEVIAVREPFDHFCWDLYARVGEFYKADESRLELKKKTLHAMEKGEGEEAEMGAIIADRIVKCHLKTMERLGIGYDLLAWEGDILRSHFWNRAFELLKQSGAIYLAEDGKNKGCWVMRLAESDAFAAMDDPDKIIVRSDGTVTYVGKDIAYHLWKFGRLDRDFHYRKYTVDHDGHALWTSTSEYDLAEPYHHVPADVIYNVIDVGQEYTQKVVAESMRVIAGDETAAGFNHFSYEKVALTPASCRDLGVTLEPGEENRPFIAMSGRRGLGVKADDMLDMLERKAREEVARRNPDFSEEDVREASRLIAVGALRYYMIKFTRKQVLAFDFESALSFEGESGPYLSYAMVRANNIFAKLQDLESVDDATIDGLAEQIDWSILDRGEDGDGIWELVTLLARMPALAADAVRGMELSIFAKYAYAVAQKFNAWYHKYPILHEQDAALKQARTVVLQLFRSRYRTALALMGIVAPRRM